MRTHKPLLLTVAETAQLLRIQRCKVYILIADRTLDATKIGCTWRIRTSSVERLIGELPAEAIPGASDTPELQAA